MPNIAIAAARYTLIDLGAMCSGRTSQACDINDCGQVVGYTYSSTIKREVGFIYTPGSGMQFISSGYHMYASSINNLGQVAGMAFDGNYVTHSFLYSPGEGCQHISTYPYDNRACDINDSGQVVGVVENSDNTSSGFVYTTSSGISTISGTGSAVAINNAGQIAGYISTNTDSGTINQAYVYTPETGISNIGCLDGGNNSIAYDINDAGQVVGYGNTSSSSSSQAFIYTPSTGIQALDKSGVCFSSIAFGINNKGQVVGEGHSSSWPFRSTAFLCDPGDVMVNLASLVDSSITGWDLISASDINDSGMIVGVGEHNNQLQAYLLVPVPEPSGLLTLAVFVVGFAGCIRKTIKQAVIM